MKSILPLVLALVSLPGIGRAQTFAIDTQRSSITVRAYKSGLFSVFAHDHEIHAPLQSGSIAVSPTPGVEFSVSVEKMTVLDPELDRSKRAEVQSTMLGPKVLDVARYPEIRFRSTHAEASGPNEWSVHGDLTIRGQTRPVEIVAKETGVSYRGAVTINQKDFGIQTISLAGGTVKVKPDIRIEFEIFRQEASPAAAARLQAAD